MAFFSNRCPLRGLLGVRGQEGEVRTPVSRHCETKASLIVAAPAMREAGPLHICPRDWPFGGPPPGRALPWRAWIPGLYGYGLDLFSDVLCTTIDARPPFLMALSRLHSRVPCRRRSWTQRGGPAVPDKVCYYTRLRPAAIVTDRFLPLCSSSSSSSSSLAPPLDPQTDRHQRRQQRQHIHTHDRPTARIAHVQPQIPEATSPQQLRRGDAGWPVEHGFRRR